MKLTFELDMMIPPVAKAISILTDRARVCVHDIHYDQANGIVDIPMQRRELKGFKKSFSGEMQLVYGQTMIQSVLTIRQVEEMKLEVDERLVTDCHSCFTILFGLKIDDNRLYLGSAEEIQGNTLCQIFIQVKEISIEYRDQVIK